MKKKVSKAYRAFIELPDGSFASFESIYNDLMNKLQEISQEHLDKLQEIAEEYLDKLFLVEEKEVDEER